MALACTFGNSFTLPAVFFMTLLPPALADRALGYAAVFMLAWSPALWSLGYAMVVGSGEEQGVPLTSPAAAASDSAGGRGAPGGPRQMQQWQQQQQRGLPGGGSGGGSGAAGPPGELRRIAAGADWEVVEPLQGAPGSAFPPTGDSSSSASSSGGSEEPLHAPHCHPAAFDRVMQYQLLRALRQFAAQALNPPVLGILAGLAVGLTPWGRALLASVQAGRGAAGAAAAGLAPGGGAGGLPLELGLLHGALRMALEVVELLAGGALAVQTLVLAASLLSKEGGGGASGGAGAGAAAASKSAGGALRALGRALLPEDAMEGRALAVLSLTR